jgi:hypothetical protein
MTLTSVIGLFKQRLRISALLERRTGFTQQDFIKQLACSYGSRCRAAVDPSTPLAEQAKVMAGLVGGTDDQYEAGNSYLSRGDFTRFRELTVAYDLPRRIYRAAGLGSATLSISARNLALWTSFDGADPESASISSETVGVGGGVIGGAASGIPQTRSWTIRFDLGLGGK